MSDALSAETKDLLDGIRTWVEIESHTPDIAGVNALADRISADYAKCGAGVTRVAGTGYGDHLVVRAPWGGQSNTPGILIISHMDTVHPKGTLATFPFRTEGDLAFGPGIYDMKGGAYCAMRAVSENPSLAGVYGIDVAMVIRMTWIIGAGLACVAGVMSGLLVQIRPYMGFDLLLPLFAAAILGGIGSIPGAMLGGLIIGLAEAMTVQLIGAEWRAAVAFVLLVAVLIVRPTGLFGQRG